MGYNGWQMFFSFSEKERESLIRATPKGWTTEDFVKDAALREAEMVNRQFDEYGETEGDRTPEVHSP